MSHTIDLTLDGLSCGHCVKRVKESLEQRPDVESADVTIDHAAVTGSASAQALIDTIKQAGYGAELRQLRLPGAKCLAGGTRSRAGTGQSCGAYCAGHGQCLRRRISAGR